METAWICLQVTTGLALAASVLHVLRYRDTRLAATSPVRNVAFAYSWGVYACYLACCFAESDGAALPWLRVLLAVNTIVRGQLSLLRLYDESQLDSITYLKNYMLGLMRMNRVQDSYSLHGHLIEKMNENRYGVLFFLMFLELVYAIKFSFSSEFAASVYFTQAQIFGFLLLFGLLFYGAVGCCRMRYAPEHNQNYQVVYMMGIYGFNQCVLFMFVFVALTIAQCYGSMQNREQLKIVDYFFSLLGFYLVLIVSNFVQTRILVRLFRKPQSVSEQGTQAARLLQMESLNEQQQLGSVFNRKIKAQRYQRAFLIVLSYLIIYVVPLGLKKRYALVDVILNLMLIIGFYSFLCIYGDGFKAHKDVLRLLSPTILDRESRALVRFWIVDYMSFLYKFSWGLLRCVYVAEMLVHYMVQPQSTKIQMPWKTIVIVTLDFVDKRYYNRIE